MIQREGGTASSHRNFYLEELLNFQLIFSLFFGVVSHQNGWLQPKERKKEKTLGGTPSTSSHRNFYLGELLNFQLVLSLLFLG
jgi:hypothetical protein